VGTEKNSRIWFRRVILGLVCTLGVTIAVLFYMIVTFDLTAHRHKLLAFINQGLEREIRVDGKIELKLSLSPKILAEHVSIGSPPWTSGSDFVKAKYIQVQFALLPLLGRKLKIQKLNIMGAYVHLETDQGGAQNWRMRWRGRLKPLIKLSPDIPDIYIEDSSITFHGKNRPGITLSVETLKGNLSVEEPFSLTGAFMFRGLPLELSLHARRLKNEEKPFDIRLKTTGTNIYGSGMYTPKHSPSLRINLENNFIDLSKYINQKDKPAESIPPKTSTTNTKRKIPNFIPNVNLLSNLSMEVQIDDLHVMYEEESITTIDARLSIIDGKLLLSPWQSRSSAGSTTKARFFWDTFESPSRTDLSLEMEGLDYGLILNNLDIRDDIVGKLDMRMDLKASGSSFHDLLGSANGRLEIVLDKGRTPRRVLELWSGGLVRLLIPTTWFEEDVTDLNCAVGRFEITNGIIRSNLLLSDTPRITVAGETILDLKTEQVSGLFKPKNKEAVLLRYGRPIKVSGTLSDLKAETVGSNIVALGKLALGLSYPASILLLYGDLGTTDKNPCEALLYQDLTKKNKQLEQ
jgi:uncharacterized protein involved in outer membrane biogenesis